MDGMNSRIGECWYEVAAIRKDGSERGLSFPTRDGKTLTAYRFLYLPRWLYRPYRLLRPPSWPTRDLNQNAG